MNPNVVLKKHIDLCVQEVTLDQLQDIQARFDIPGDAKVAQNDDDYDLCIKWEVG